MLSRPWFCLLSRPAKLFFRGIKAMDFDVRVFLIVQQTFNYIVESCYRAILQSFFAWT